MKIAFVYLNNDKCVGRGAGYIASAILDEGHDLTLFDTAYDTLEDVIAMVISGSYDMLMISATSMFYRSAQRLSAEVKNATGIPVMLGGVHATIVKNEILSEWKSIDHICIGDGEQFVLDYLRTGKLSDNPNPPTNLDKLPTFRYELFRDASVVQDYPLPGFCYVSATRGCPYHCTFCCNSTYLDMYGKAFLRKRSVDSVIDELLWLKQRYLVKLFYFADEMLLVDDEYVHDLLWRVHNQVQIPYGCMCRVEKINKETVELFKATDCRYVAMGIECGDEQFRRDFLKRNMTNEQIVNAFRLVRQVPDVTLTSFNMTGYPVSYDVRLTEATRALNEIIKPDIVQTSVFYPFRGTWLHDYCVERDLIDPDKLASADEYFTHSVLRSPIHD